MKHGIIVLQQLRTIIYFTFSNFLADCEYQMAKPSECPPPLPFCFLWKTIVRKRGS